MLWMMTIGTVPRVFQSREALTEKADGLRGIKQSYIDTFVVLLTSPQL